MSPPCGPRPSATLYYHTTDGGESYRTPLSGAGGAATVRRRRRRRLKFGFSVLSPPSAQRRIVLLYSWQRQSGYTGPGGAGRIYKTALRDSSRTPRRKHFPLRQTNFHRATPPPPPSHTQSRRLSVPDVFMSFAYTYITAAHLAFVPIQCMYLFAYSHTHTQIIPDR